MSRVMYYNSVEEEYSHLQTVNSNAEALLLNTAGIIRNFMMYGTFGKQTDSILLRNFVVSADYMSLPLETVGVNKNSFPHIVMVERIKSLVEGINQQLLGLPEETLYYDGLLNLPYSNVSVLAEIASILNIEKDKEKFHVQYFNAMVTPLVESIRDQQMTGYSFTNEGYLEVCESFTYALVNSGLTDYLGNKYSTVNKTSSFIDEMIKIMNLYISRYGESSYVNQIRCGARMVQYINRIKFNIN